MDRFLALGCRLRKPLKVATYSTYSLPPRPEHSYQPGIFQLLASFRRQHSFDQPQNLELQEHIYHRVIHGVQRVRQGGGPAENHHRLRRVQLIAESGHGKSSGAASHAFH